MEIDCDLLAVLADGTEVFLVCATLGDLGKILKEYYPNLADPVQEAGIKFSQIVGFRIKLPEGYLVD